MVELPNYIQKINNKSDTKVYAAMSGGVDSSVSAALLADAGFNVTGCFMRVWQPPFLNCSMEGEKQDAMEVAAHLDIDFQTVDLADEYKNRVVDYMIAEYEAGRTPNPDVMCNGEIKFGAFYDWTMNKNADYIATGHYARKRNSKAKSQNSKAQLLRGTDEHKDQSYFLWQFTQEKLQNTLFPVGGIEKGQVRKIAQNFDIPVAEKDDSQGLCFLGEIDMQDFLAEFIDLEKGEVINKSGEVIGTHKGAEVYTIGQRRGFTVTKKEPDSGPWYVVDKSIENNTITVSEDNSETGPVYNGKEIRLANVNWIVNAPQPGDQYKAQIRYNQSAQECKVMNVEGGAWEVVFKKPLRAVAVGQSCVVYDEGVCLGGGVIEEVSGEK